MFITKSRSEKIITGEQILAAGLEYRTNAVRIIKYNFCRKMTLEGLCSEKCVNCQAQILNALTRIDPATAKSPSAIFIWRLRNEASKAAEAVTTEKKVVVKRDKLGEVVKTDVWAQLLDDCVSA